MLFLFDKSVRTFTNSINKDDVHNNLLYIMYVCFALLEEDGIMYVIECVVE